jgi:hypothetical protein
MHVDQAIGKRGYVAESASKRRHWLEEEREEQQGIVIVTFLET